MTSVKECRDRTKKIFLERGLGQTIKHLREVLSPDSEVYDNFVLLSAEHIEIEQDVISGVLSDESRQVRLAKLRGRVMFTINQLMPRDVTDPKEKSSIDKELDTGSSSEIDLDEIYQLKDFEMNVDECAGDLDAATTKFELLTEKSNPLFKRENTATKKMISQIGFVSGKSKIDLRLFKKWVAEYFSEIKIYGKNLSLISEEMTDAYYDFVRLHLILLQANYAKYGDVPGDKLIQIKGLYSELRTTLREAKSAVGKKKNELKTISATLKSHVNTNKLESAIDSVDYFINNFDKIILYAFQFEEGLDMIGIKYKDKLV